MNTSTVIRPQTLTNGLAGILRLIGGFTLAARGKADPATSSVRPLVSPATAEGTADLSLRRHARSGLSCEWRSDSGLSCRWH